MRSVDDEFYMDDYDEEGDGGGDSFIVVPNDDDDGGEDDSKNVLDDSGGVVSKTDKGAYSNTELTSYEVKLMTLYDQLKIIGAKATSFKDSGYDIAITVIEANPGNTDKSTIQKHAMEAINSQGKSRILGSSYNPSGLMTGDDVDEDFTKDGISGTSDKLIEDAKNQVTRFIDYLAKRDLSKDNLSNKKRKRRHIPAFIIFLFSSGLYDLIIDCPTLPDLYKREVDNAFKKITKQKLDIVELLARAYEDRNRPKVAERVRKMGIYWFEREPAEIRTLGAYSDLDITTEDVMTYKEYKSKFINTSKAITQDVMAKLIAVYQEDGTFETLKDKTRQDAIEEAKTEFRNWSENNPIDSELAQKVIWGKI